MKTIFFLMLPIALIVGCGQEDEPTPQKRDNYQVKLTCDKDAPDYIQMRNGGSTQKVSIFIGHPQINGQPVAEKELDFDYFGSFYYKVEDQWFECGGFEEGKPTQFGFNGYHGLPCSHVDEMRPIELIVWVPDTVEGPDKIDASLGCTPTVESPK